MVEDIGLSAETTDAVQELLVGEPHYMLEVCCLQGPYYAKVVFPERKYSQHILVMIDLKCQSVSLLEEVFYLESACDGLLPVVPPVG